MISTRGLKTDAINHLFSSWSTFRKSVVPNHWTFIQPSSVFQHTSHGFFHSGRNDLKADFRRIFKLRSCFKTLQKVSCVWIGINSVMVFGSNFWSTIYRLLAGTVCVKEGLESTQRRLWLKRQGSMNMLSECFGMFFFFTVT